MSLFWIGIAVFLIGVLIRIFYKIKYYRDYKSNAHTELTKSEMRSKYRPLIFVGLTIEVVGCIITVISCFIS